MIDNALLSERAYQLFWLFGLHWPRPPEVESAGEAVPGRLLAAAGKGFPAADQALLAALEGLQSACQRTAACCAAQL